MQNKRLFGFAAVGLAAAIAVPTIAMGNARRDEGSGAAFKAAYTPFTARLLGSNEVPVAPATTAGDPDGVGAAAVTFDLIDPLNLVTGAEVCWDLSYSGITGTPVGAHIHRGATGVNGPVVQNLFPTLGANSGTGCLDLAPALATEIMTTPAGFYVNVHTSDFPGGALRGQLAKGPAPAGEAHLLPVPLRAYDSRDAAGPKIAPNETRTISLASGRDGAGVVFLAVPPGATAAIVTLTVTETGTGIGGAGGFLTMYNAALPSQPATSNINWSGPNENIAVSTQVEVDSAGRVKVGAGANQTHFVIDVVGYLF